MMIISEGYITGLLTNYYECADNKKSSCKRINALTGGKTF